jgi:hypothetical protein
MEFQHSSLSLYIESKRFNCIQKRGSTAYKKEVQLHTKKRFNCIQKRGSTAYKKEVQLHTKKRFNCIQKRGATAYKTTTMEIQYTT